MTVTTSKYWHTHPRKATRLGLILCLSTLLLSPIGTVHPQNRSAGLDLPSIKPIVQYKPKLALQVFSADGVRIGQFGDELRYYTPFSQTPKNLINAILAIEDARFFEHSGIDPKGIARAVISMATGGRRQGASTLTQQLVRTMVLTREISVERKAKEIALALQVEKALSKERIFEIYMNEIFLGHRSYGFSAAAQTYFGKELKDITLAQAALLAGLPQNPSYANPITNYERAIKRQHVVLDRMREVGFITPAQLASAKAEKISIRVAGTPNLYAAHVAEMARAAAFQRFGANAYTAGVRVHTTIKAKDQAAAHAAVRAGIIGLDRRNAWRGPEAQVSLAPESNASWEEQAAKALSSRPDDETLPLALVLKASPNSVQVMLRNKETLTLTGASLRAAAAGLRSGAPASLKIERGALVRLYRVGDIWSLWQWPKAEGALVAVEPLTGRVRALVGSFDFRTQPLNHAYQAWRQPGSAFKPFIYSAALEQGIMPATLADDTPFNTVEGWSPQNYDGGYTGTITVREALAKSSNMVSIRLLESIGVGPVKDWLPRFGFETAKHPANLTMALGTGSVTPMQMSLAYAVFANGGHLVRPVLIEKIIDGSGKVVFQAPAPTRLSDKDRTLSARNAWLTGQLLNEVTATGTAASARKALGRSDLYGKTGTTDKSVDAWFVGYQPTLSAAVWLGHSKPSSLGAKETGGRTALPIWIGFMKSALNGVRSASSPAPKGVVRDGADWVYADSEQATEQASPAAWRRTLKDAASSGTNPVPPVSPPTPSETLGTPAGTHSAEDSENEPQSDEDYKSQNNKKPPTLLDSIIDAIQNRDGSADAPALPDSR